MREALLLREVFPELLASHHDQVWNRLRRRGLWGHEAEDLLREAFFALHNHILENRSRTTPRDAPQSERQLRSLVVGHANWLFVGSDETAEWTCTFVPLVASCQLHGLDPEGYLRDLFRRCVQAACTSDADCNGLFCVESAFADNCNSTGMACQSELDECLIDADCNGSECSFKDDHRACIPLMCIS